MRLISSRRLVLSVPLHHFMQRTTMASSPRPGLLKRWAMGKPGGFLKMAGRCLLLRFLSITEHALGFRPRQVLLKK